MEGCKEELSEQLKILKQKKGQIEQELDLTNERFQEFMNKATHSETVLKGQISYLEGKINDIKFVFISTS